MTLGVLRNSVGEGKSRMKPTGARGRSQPHPNHRGPAAANFLSTLGLIKNLDGQGLPRPDSTLCLLYPNQSRLETPESLKEGGGRYGLCCHPPELGLDVPMLMASGSQLGKPGIRNARNPYFRGHWNGRKPPQGTLRHLQVGRESTGRCHPRCLGVADSAPLLDPGASVAQPGGCSHPSVPSSSEISMTPRLDLRV